MCKFVTMLCNKVFILLSAVKSLDKNLFFVILEGLKMTASFPFRHVSAVKFILVQKKLAVFFLYNTIFKLLKRPPTALVCCVHSCRCQFVSNQSLYQFAFVVIKQCISVGTVKTRQWDDVCKTWIKMLQKWKKPLLYWNNGSPTSRSFAVYLFNPDEILTFHVYIHTQHNPLTH